MTAVRWVEYVVQVMVKETLGSFGSKRGPVHHFRFCAHSQGEAVALAARNVPSKGFPYDEREVRVVSSLPVFWADIEEARLAAIMRRTDHLDPFPMVHAPLRSLREVQGERDESEAA